MRDSAANSTPASCASETAAPAVAGGSGAQNCPPPLPPAAIADLTTLPPTVTPTVALSTVWRTGSSSAIATAAPAAPRAAQEPPSDPTTSTSSVPSTTTTLTNTLERTQSAALRALNAPAFQSQASSSTASKPAKSTSSRTTLSSQPVVVRTYSGPRHHSRSAAGLHSPRFFGSMNSHRPQSALSTGLASRTAKLPTVDDFSFSAILRAVDPEIRDAIDAIAEICARSRLSLADEYDAHLPPQGTITETGPGWAAGVGSLAGRGRLSRIGHGWPQTEFTLTSVPEASSSSERLAGESRGSASSKKRTRSAYGSLKSVISGGSGSGSGKKKAADEASSPPEEAHRAEPPFVTLITSPQASKQLSLDQSSTITDVPASPTAQPHSATQTEVAKNTHRRNTSTASNLTSRTRTSTLSSLASWIPWSRPTAMDPGLSDELTKAETRLREMLVSSQSASSGRGKAAVSVA